MSKREHGKIVFTDLEDEKGKIQIIFRKDVTSNFDVLDVIERGDIIGIKGNIVRTQRGELSLLVKEWKVLAKALRPLPDTWHGLKDVETRYRQRYVDLILNKEVKETFLTIHKAIHFIRSFLNEKGFIEVYTPILQPIYGGAFARPFKTFHHALEEWRWLRIAPELYLKRLLVGGFEKVYEFAPCFRNEGIDAQHNPEFIQLELYWAYVDYENVMKLIEELIYNLVKKLFGSEKIEYQGREIDFSPPWKRIRLVDAIKEYSGLDVEHMSDEELKEHAKSLGIEAERRGEIIEKLFDHYAKPNLINPTFATHFPVDITPLAKRADKNYAERFDLHCWNGSS
jgi:lysyl-tRNA synthetase class 2